VDDHYFGGVDNVDDPRSGAEVGGAGGEQETVYLHRFQSADSWLEKDTQSRDSGRQILGKSMENWEK